MQSTLPNKQFKLITKDTATLPIHFIYLDWLTRGYAQPPQNTMPTLKLHSSAFYDIAELLASGYTSDELMNHPYGLTERGRGILTAYSFNELAGGDDAMVKTVAQYKAKLPSSLSTAQDILTALRSLRSALAKLPPHKVVTDFLDALELFSIGTAEHDISLVPVTDNSPYVRAIAVVRACDKAIKDNETLPIDSTELAVLKDKVINYPDKKNEAIRQAILAKIEFIEKVQPAPKEAEREPTLICPSLDEAIKFINGFQSLDMSKLPGLANGIQNFIDEIKEDFNAKYIPQSRESEVEATIATLELLYDKTLTYRKEYFGY